MNVFMCITNTVKVGIIIISSGHNFKTFIAKKIYIYISQESLPVIVTGGCCCNHRTTARGPGWSSQTLANPAKYLHR
jgi:hypothetical protein